MDQYQDQVMEEERQGLLNQLSLDLLVRRLGSTVLRRKFKEIYVKLNDGQEWTDGPVSAKKFCQGKWGNGAYVNAQVKQQEMMEGGNIQNWDLHCLQSVITQMLTTALKEQQKSKSSGGSSCKKGGSSQPTLTPFNWDSRWGSQMSNIRQLANIRNSIAHMPTGTLSQSEFKEKWDDAVLALKGLGATSKEIKKIQEITRSAFNLTNPSPAQQGQGQGQNQWSDVQKESSPKSKESSEEERETIEELRAKIEELQLQNQIQVKIQEPSKIKVDTEKEDEVKGQLNNEIVIPLVVVVNKKNELRAESLVRKGDFSSRSEDWDEALEYYTKALEIPEISDDLQRKIYLNRSWVHLKILEIPEPPFNLNLSESGAFKSKKKSNGKMSSRSPSQSNTKSPRESKFVDEKLLEMDHQKWPEKLTEEVKKFHLTEGMADAESALQLSPDQQSSLVFYRLAQFHQLNGDWKSALTYFDLAVGQSTLDSQLEFDRNKCQLELLNQAEVEEFHWIPGKKNQTMAGVMVRRDLKKWTEVMDDANMMDDPQQILYALVVEAHFVAQGYAFEDGAEQNAPVAGAQGVTKQAFEDVVKMYEEVANGGLASGVYNLGLLLQEGNGVQSADFSGAVRLFKIAANFPIHHKAEDWAKEGVFEAQYRLGLCYEFGLGVGKDEKRALHWFEMARMGDFARASRKLGDIYSQGLLGVSKDIVMALFCWEEAAAQGDTVAATTATLYQLPFRQSPMDLSIMLYNYSLAISLNFEDGTPTMIATMLDRKQEFESALCTVLQKLNQAQSHYEPNMELEPEEVFWNLFALTDHTLHTIHLLELAQTPEFQRKLEATPNWRKQFGYTDRLIKASQACVRGLTALQELNKLYQEFMCKGDTKGRQPFDREYPPEIRQISGYSAEQIESILAREGQLVTLILDSFATSIRLVGAAFFRDRPCQYLIHCLVKKVYDTAQPLSKNSSPTEFRHFSNAALLLFYTPESELQCGSRREIFERSFDTEHFPETYTTMAGTAVLGSFGDFEGAAETLEKFWMILVHLNHTGITNQCDILFVRALCCKSAALTRGVNSVNRKKIKEAMGLFNKLLSVCPKDEPRRAEAHYQLALCTLYLEKMKVKGQVKSSAEDIVQKVLPYFNQGEEAEQEFPWKDFQGPDKSPVKLYLQRKLEELEALVKKVPGQSPTPNSESSCFGRLVDPYFRFPISSFPLKLRGSRRAEVITGFRRFFKAARDKTGPGPSSPFSSLLLLPSRQLTDLLNLPGSPFNWDKKYFHSKIVGCYTIVEPILHCRYTCSCKCKLSMENPELNNIYGFTVVQDESGNVFNLQLSIIMQHRGDGDQEEQVGALGVGDQIIIVRPFIRLDPEAGTSLIVFNADEQIFHLSSRSRCKEKQEQGAKKCGFCGKIGGTQDLQQCSKCQSVYYCGKECQTADWKELKHKLICPYLKDVSV